MEANASAWVASETRGRPPLTPEEIAEFQKLASKVDALRERYSYLTVPQACARVGITETDIAVTGPAEIPPIN